MQLEEIIVRAMDSNGALNFRDFMEMCLYYPQKGYYTSQSIRTGKQGDFYTSPQLGALFGFMIARQIEQMWDHLGKVPFSIVEFGAGSGLLCNDILEALQENRPLYKELVYHVVEKGGSFRCKHKNFSEKIVIHENSETINSIEGCIISNELLDNLSFHQVVMNNQLMEIYVCSVNGGFKEIMQPAQKQLSDYFTELNITLPEGFRTEVNLSALTWLESISKILKKGFVLTIDYGFPSYELYHQSRKNGTMVCYHKHKINFCPYHNIGEQDITAHVNFSALKHWGQKVLLKPLGYTTQGKFLSGLGLGAYLSQKQYNGMSPDTLKTLLVDLGSKMKVFIQQKNMPSLNLSGLLFSQKLV